MNALVIFLIFRITLSLIFPIPFNNGNEISLKNGEISKTYNILMYRCDICYSYFLTKDDLMKHLEQYHPQEYEDINNITDKDSYFSRLLKKYESPLK
ncbi:MAG TPA: C2H2-type zinc finger protein [Caldisericia bacterium]|jgi:hypothetical protein|nr:C2H2-type zinc finger protein [Caldisericia bacterium]HOW03441.1 C2H2-type zinc finger protein [Caldisericia bacterium]HPO29019.1 C2H2-type zinc finger protein [Caldisericia bacterium]HQG82457.1 C2H2-type zinc finger protein [Caldisericia bacterium]HXK70613.1 C2H2-type zinc finger protein [Caldisericia bacterium]